jgi:hypothetical protein
MSTSRDFFVKRFDFQGHNIGCVAGRNCETPSRFQIGWKFDNNVNGVKTETLTSRSACERHARIFAFKKGLQFPRAGA